METLHKSVLLEESIKYLNLKKDSKIVDCTLGYGGHSSEILKQIPNGFLYCFDQDIDAINFSQKRLSDIASNFEIIQNNFVNIENEIKKRTDFVDGILYDLGVSSPQLDLDDRGFSFHKDAKLDMRMDKSATLSAYEVVNNYTYEELTNILYKYGEEKYASMIVKNIIKHREIKPIETTLELTEIIKMSVPEKYRREKHPARKTFQAIRIEVNHELEVFEKSIKSALDLINVGGRICVITFHSLEDRLCKNIFKEVSDIDPLLKKMPIIPEDKLPKFKAIANISPSCEEINYNNRARSARLRVIERVR